MVRTDAVRADRLTVIGTRVALVAGPVVCGQLIVQLRHERIARDFGDDGCRSRGCAVAVGLDHRTHPEPGRARRGDVVVIAVEDHDGVLGHDAVRTKVGDRANRREAQSPHDADLVDLGGARPAHGARRDPRRRAGRDGRTLGLGHELGVAQTLRHALARPGRVDDGSSDGDRPGEGAAPHLVARDHEGVFAQEPPLQSQSRLRDGHGAGSSADGSGTPAKSS